MKKIKVCVSRTRAMELSEEDYKYLLQVIREGDDQAFDEFTEIPIEGKMGVFNHDKFDWTISKLMEWMNMSSDNRAADLLLKSIIEGEE